MTKQNIFEPQFWEQAWQEFMQKNRPFEMGAGAFEQVERWNRRAQNFSLHTGGLHGNRRQADVFDFLQRTGVFKDKMAVLDIGCGPGNFAIPLARAGHSVVALDPARKMLEILESRLDPEITRLVTPVQDLWEDVDVVSRGWEKNFDFVFASMTPGLQDRATIEKMNLCSRGWCYLSTFAGPRKYSLYEEIWPLLLGKKFANHVNDIVFPFNMLYAMGYRPDLTFVDNSQTRSEPVEVVVDDIISHLTFTEADNVITADLLGRLRELIEARSEGGKVTHQISSQVGMMLWQVNRVG